MILGPYQLDEARAETLSMVKRYFEECRKKFFPRVTKDAPKFAIRKMKNNWGQYVSNISGSVSELWVHPDLGLHPDTARKVVFHETIHWADPTSRLDPEMKITAGHGRYFKDMMREVNAREGTDYVTITGNYAEVKYTKPFWAYWFTAPNGDIIYMWSSKKYDDLGDIMKDQNRLRFNKNEAWQAQCTLRNVQLDTPNTPNTKRMKIYFIRAGTDNPITNECRDWFKSQQTENNKTRLSVVWDPTSLRRAK